MGVRIQDGITVVGPGNWGTSLLAGIRAAELPVVGIVGRERRAGLVPGEGVIDQQEAEFDAEMIWICVPDGRVAEAAQKIAGRRGDLHGQTVVHSSGALTVEALDEVRRAGATTGGIAPIFTFPTREVVSLSGMLFAVECPSDDNGSLWQKLSHLVRRLGGTPVRIPSEKKVLYHAAATLASPLLVSALKAASQVAQLAGFDRTEASVMLEALAGATIRNYFEKGEAESFSGAFARGDTRTVELHLQALQAHPTLHGVYHALAKQAVAELGTRNRDDFEQMLRMVPPAGAHRT